MTLGRRSLAVVCIALLAIAALTACGVLLQPALLVELVGVIAFIAVALRWVDGDALPHPPLVALRASARLPRGSLLR